MEALQPVAAYIATQGDQAQVLCKKASPLQNKY